MEINSKTIQEAVKKLRDYQKNMPPSALNLMASTDTISLISSFIPAKVSGYEGVYAGFPVIKNDLIPHKKLLVNYDDGSVKIIDL